MIYDSDNDILILDMEQSDIENIVQGEREQGWNATADKYVTRLRERDEGKAIAFAAEYNGYIAGYIFVYPDSAYGAFAGQGYPEIVDFGVLEKYRRRGIGNKLMDVAEKTHRSMAIPYISESVCTAVTGVRSVCMQNAGISLMAAVSGMEKRYARKMRSAVMMMIWSYIYGKSCKTVYTAFPLAASSSGGYSTT